MSHGHAYTHARRGPSQHKVTFGTSQQDSAITGTSQHKVTFGPSHHGRLRRQNRPHAAYAAVAGSLPASGRGATHRGSAWRHCVRAPAVATHAGCPRARAAAASQITMLCFACIGLVYIGRDSAVCLSVGCWHRLWCHRAWLRQRSSTTAGAIGHFYHIGSASGAFIIGVPSTIPTTTTWGHIPRVLSPCNQDPAITSAALGMLQSLVPRRC